LARAFKSPENLLATSPSVAQRMLPGNIGEGISIEANVNVIKKAARIIVPFTIIHL